MGSTPIDGIDRLLANCLFNYYIAVVAELADALDSKSSSRKRVWVRPPSTALLRFYKSGVARFIKPFLLVFLVQKFVTWRDLFVLVDHNAISSTFLFYLRDNLILDELYKGTF